MSAADFSFGVAILAAGASRRMGRPKLLLPWDGATILEHVVGQWRNLGATQVAVVCRPGDSGMETALTRLGFGHHEWVVNPNPDEGMFSSIQAAALWKGWGDGLSHYVVTLGDQPHLSLKTLEALLAFAEKSTDTICQPSFKARPRHPVILPRRLFHEVGAAQEVTFRGFLERSDMKRRLCEIDDPGLNIDLDTPEEYEAVREKWLQGADQ